MLKPCFSFRQRSNTRSHMACLAPWGGVVCGQAVIVDVDVIVVAMVWVRVEAGDVCRGLKENLNNMVGFGGFWYLSCVFARSEPLENGVVFLNLMRNFQNYL